MEKIRRCRYCGNETTTKPGLHNWKNLFRKPTLDEWITLAIIILMLFSYYQYKVDIKNLIDYYEGGDYYSNQMQLKDQGININPLNNPPIVIQDSLNESDGG